MKCILFNDKFGLTKAVLEGRKTVTRRIISAKTIEHILEDFKQEYFEGTLDVLESDKEYIEQYFLIEYRGKCFRRGDIIAVAQSYKDAGIEQSMEITHTKWVKSIQKYRAPRTLKFTKNCAKDDFAWENKMYVKADLMPHQIRITGVRVERLQDISDEDCKKEGILHAFLGYYVPGIKCKDWENESHVDTEDFKTWKLFPTPREAFAALIDKVSDKGTWDSNPWVFVYEFELVK